VAIVRARSPGPAHARTPGTTGVVDTVEAPAYPPAHIANRRGLWTGV